MNFLKINKKQRRKMEKDKIYIGIDPGAKGFISAITDGGYKFYSISDLTP